MLASKPGVRHSDLRSIMDGVANRFGGRVRMLAKGAHAQGKGIFVTTGQRMTIEGFDFVGAKVPDRNGAGIRLEKGSLTLRDCRFQDNENGLLAANDGSIELRIEACDFGAIARMIAGPPAIHTGGDDIGEIARMVRMTPGTEGEDVAGRRSRAPRHGRHDELAASGAHPAPGRSDRAARA